MGTIKEDFETNFIPRIKLMLKKEKNHYDYLCSVEGRASSSMLDKFKETTLYNIEQLEQKLVEYTNYANNL